MTLFYIAARTTSLEAIQEISAQQTQTPYTNQCDSSQAGWDQSTGKQVMDPKSNDHGDSDSTPDPKDSDAADSHIQRRMRLAKGGSAEALSELLEELRDYLRIVARKAIDSDIQGKLSASDLVQETMLQANRNFSQFKGADAPQFRAWLRRILINNLINHYREFRKTKKRELGREVSGADLDHLPSDDLDSPSAQMIANEDVKRLEQAMAQLSPDFQQVIHLRHREQLTFAEVGAQMDRAPDAARMLWYRAFEQLSKIIEEGE